MTRRRRTALAACMLVGLALAVPGCRRDGDTDVLSLELEAAANCTDQVGKLSLMSVRSLKVAVWGEDGEGQTCRVGEDRCIDLDGSPSSVADLEAALHGAQDPLLDVAADEALEIAVLGFTGAGCASAEPQACGVRSLADASEGAVSVTIECNRIRVDPCQLSDPPLCP